MPGLLRGVARTAVIAGTATSVSNRVSRRQAGRWAAKEQQADSPPPAYQDEPEEEPAGGGMDDRLAQLKSLGDLKAQGVLSEAEFQEQKAQILRS